ncbi:MAG: hypothetical protein KF723_20330 [Rhizobiaceae bacterium]|nr:hypothetical protein [Rhizobiaceae bacterium]
MAKIWPVFEGREPTVGGPWAEIKLADAIELFELTRDAYVTNLEGSPRFGDQSQDLRFRGFKHVLVEVEEKEGRREQWRSGFYRSNVEPSQAFDRLLKHALASALGKQNVIRVEHAAATDSRGQEAIRVTAVIAPNAARELHPDATLEALVRLQDRLREMREERTPIVEYATEAELAQNAGN